MVFFPVFVPWSGSKVSKALSTNSQPSEFNKEEITEYKNQHKMTLTRQSDLRSY
jgi:hypothetical protein